MTQKKSSDEYSDEEAQRRFMASLEAAVNTPPKPLKSMTPKRPKSKRKKARQGGKP
jgi:hypothetical protein